MRPAPSGEGGRTSWRPSLPCRRRAPCPTSTPLLDPEEDVARRRRPLSARAAPPHLTLTPSSCFIRRGKEERRGGEGRRKEGLFGRAPARHSRSWSGGAALLWLRRLLLQNGSDSLESEHGVTPHRGRLVGL